MLFSKLKFLRTMMTRLKTARYKLSTTVQAVKLQVHPGSTLRDPTEILVEIPPDSIIESEGQVAESGLINIRWNSEVFSVYYEDLLERSQLLSAS